MKASEKCENCGSIVTNQFAKVFGDQNDTIHHCPDCLKDMGINRQMMQNGAGAVTDLENTPRQ